MNTIGAHSVCPLHTDGRDENTRRGVQKSRTKSPGQPYVGLLHSHNTVNKPLHVLWGKKGKKYIEQPSTCEEYEKDLLFLSTLPKPQYSLFSELYKHYLMHIGHVKNSFTVWWKETLMDCDQHSEFTLVDRLQSLGTNINNIHRTWEHLDFCHHIHGQAKVELRNNHEVRRGSTRTIALLQYTHSYFLLCLTAWARLIQL